jgi:hypothetical protein
MHMFFNQIIRSILYAVVLDSFWLLACFFVSLFMNLLNLLVASEVRILELQSDC